MGSSEEMTLDEIVALNLRRLLDGGRAAWSGEVMSVSLLASILGVSRAQVYDMQRARPGRAHREFKWHEIVALSRAFGVSVLEIVLPPDGVLLAEGEGVIGLLDRNASTADVLDDDKNEPLDRYDMALGLFGLPPKWAEPAVLEEAARKMLDEKYRRERILTEAFEALWEQRELES